MRGRGRRRAGRRDPVGRGADGFDLGRSQELELDHTILAPLGVLGTRMDLRIIPGWISGLLRPIPSAQRCHALGAALGRAIAASDLERRVVVAASGAFSFEVGPRMSEDSHVGVPAPDWAIRVSELLAAGAVAQIVAESTPAQLAAPATPPVRSSTGSRCSDASRRARRRSWRRSARRATPTPPGR